MMTVDEYFLLSEKRLDTAGRFSTSRNYRKAQKSFSLFLDGESLQLAEMSDEVVTAYNRYLENRGVVRNTRSFYNRILRSVYNKAVSEGYAPENVRLFENVYTGVDKTHKRALDSTTLRDIKEMDLQGEEELSLTRDLFLFSFYARGMCFVDMAYLRKLNIRGPMISYVRRKTGKRLTLRVEHCMEQIIQRYAGKSFGDYVFPIIRSDKPAEAFKDYNYQLCRYNLMLKEIGCRAGLAYPLNSYAARHSWATMAQTADIPLSIISAGMGHTSEKTTRIYLAELNNAVIDEANRSVIGFLVDG